MWHIRRPGVSSTRTYRCSHTGKAGQSPPASASITTVSSIRTSTWMMVLSGLSYHRSSFAPKACRSSAADDWLPLSGVHGPLRKAAMHTLARELVAVLSSSAKEPFAATGASQRRPARAGDADRCHPAEGDGQDLTPPPMSLPRGGVRSGRIDDSGHAAQSKTRFSFWSRALRSSGVIRSRRTRSV